MKDKAAILLLIQELTGDLAYVSEQAVLRRKALERVEQSGWADELDLMVVGGVLHGIYNAIEAYFLRVAKFFENSIDEQTWHRDLLDRMALSIPTVRPALLDSQDLVDRIDELRRFRHVFRNLYKSRLHPGKLRIVNEAAEGIEEDFLAAHTRFVTWLTELAEEMG
jgi:hypothetical protein